MAAAADDLAPAHRRAVIAVIATLHAAGAWALLQVPAVREAAVQVAPMFVDLIAPPRPPEPPPPTAPAPRAVPMKRPPPPVPRVTAAASPTPAPFVAPPPPEARPAIDAPAPVEPVPPAPPAPPAPAAPPVASPPPKTIPASAVQYLEAPQLDYPRASRRAGETGRVLVRVLIDEAGLPRTVTVSQSSGHVRLDEAAIAAVRAARFKPYTENGQALAGWAFIPMSFDLEK